MRALLVLASLGFVAFAGCLDGPGPDDTPDDVAIALPDGPTTAVFHGADGLVDLEVLDAGLVAVGAMRILPTTTFEPTIGSDADGCLFMTSYRGTGTGTMIYRSCDQAETWEEVGPFYPGTEEPCFRNSNDPYVHVDRDTGRVFSSDLHALVTSTLHFSDDKGGTWTCNPLGGGLPPGVHDHQTVATGAPRDSSPVGYENMVYYCVNRVLDSVCASSLTGGLGFGPFTTVYPGFEGDLCGGLHGHVETDHEGRVYLPKGHCGNVEVAMSDDDGKTWTRSVVSDQTGVQGHEVRVAADLENNIYAFWVGADALPYLSVSTDHGASWSDPLMAAPPGVTATGFPAVYAGAEGHVAFVYVGTTAEGGHGGQDQEWNAYLGVVTDALGGAPVIQTVTANDPAEPIARGRCGDVRCGGLGDFIDVTIDPDGRPWGAFSDQEQAFVGTLEQGPSLLHGGPLEALAVVE